MMVTHRNSKQVNSNFIRTVTLVFALIVYTCGWAWCSAEEADYAAKYEPTWQSLQRYRAPRWYKDAKFGIFVHWGVYAVPAVGSEWYPRNMYKGDRKYTRGREKGLEIYKYHRTTWGDQGTFGYKDFIGRFKAQKWAPHNWADLFSKSGAKFVVMVAEHHDGFAMYDSSHTKWDSVEMGPRRDILGELGRAVRQRGMKFGASSHYAFNWNYYVHSDNFDTGDPQYSGLYSRGRFGFPLDGRHPPDREFLDHWYARTVEIVDKYQPDVLWFDFGFNAPQFEPYRRKICAYYYNKGLQWGKGVVLNYKNYKIVPFHDGTIPAEAQDILLGIGKWLSVNGEAIYDTRPWHTYGEGPTAIKAGFKGESDAKSYIATDIRFTTRPKVLYAICLDWPQKQLTIKSLSTRTFLSAAPISDIRLLGARRSVRWSRNREGLKIELPPDRPCENAFVFKILLEGQLLGRIK